MTTKRFLIAVALAVPAFVFFFFTPDYFSAKTQWVSYVLAAAFTVACALQLAGKFNKKEQR